ncbi:MAG TPA: hypothetical protein VJ476_04880 [Rhizomicrobium sp.]|nr:hypothetical protein [Rhizomicrobium sp.]
MLRQLIVTALFIFAILVVYRYRFWIVAQLKRFDAANVRRIAEQERDRADPLAHYRHTLRVAEEQVETVHEITEPDERLGTSSTRYLFEGERFASRAEAERVRAEKVRAIARGYYQDLPIALAERRKDKLN